MAFASRHTTSLASPSRRKGQGIKYYILKVSHGGSRRQEGPLCGLLLSLSDSKICLKVRKVRGLEPVMFSLTRTPPRARALIAPIQKHGGKTIENARKSSLRLCGPSATPLAAQLMRGPGRSQHGAFPSPPCPGTHTEPDHSCPPCQGQGSPRGWGGAIALIRSISIGLEGSRLTLYEEQLVSQVPFICHYDQLLSMNLVTFEQMDRPTAPDLGPLGCLKPGCLDLVGWQLEMAWPSP